jgi:isopentenyl-diphosphate delta-isomerase
MSYTHVILVDEKDNIIGTEEKLKAHQHGLLHRAFSIVIYKKTHLGIETLLQKRAESKYHCGGQWSNTCCSHPQQNMTMTNCLQKRLSFEMGLTGQSLKFADTFKYKEICKGGLTEHELDHVYLGEFKPNTINPNKDEVCDYKWMALDTLLKDIEAQPQNYTPWLMPVMKITQNKLQSL